jgi:REP element-mobilizing transposase RayT
MYHRLYYHVVWGTNDREPLITLRTARFLCGFLRGIAIQERSRILDIGIVMDHVHVLITIHPTTNWPRLIQRLKGGSSMLANREGQVDCDHPLKWAKGYSVQTVSPCNVDKVRGYLKKQSLHHPEKAIPGWEGDRSHRELLR